MSGCPLSAADPVVGVTSFHGMPVVPNRAVKPGRFYFLTDPFSGQQSVHVAAPHPVRTKVWDDMHAALPWLRGGDGDMTRFLSGIHRPAVPVKSNKGKR